MRYSVTIKRADELVRQIEDTFRDGNLPNGRTAEEYQQYCYDWILKYSHLTTPKFTMPPLASILRYRAKLAKKLVVGEEVLYWDSTPNGGCELNSPARIVRTHSTTVVLERGMSGHSAQFRVARSDIKKIKP